MMNEKTTNIDLIKAIKVQKRVIHALMMREVHTKFGDSRLGYLWAVFEPLIHIGFFLLLFTFIGRESPLDGGLPFFFITGLVPFFLFRTTVNSASSVFRANKSLFFYPMVKPIDAIIARFILDFVIFILVFLVLLIAVTVLGVSVKIDRYHEFFVLLLMLAFFGTCVGVFNAAVEYVIPVYKNVYQAMQRVLYFTSGIFFLADDMPVDFQEVLYYNPLLHYVQYARELLYFGYSSDFVDLNYAFIFTISMMCVSILLFNKYKARLMSA